MSSAADKRRLAVPGGELAFVDAGDPEAPTVLFLHGFPTSSHLWRAFVPSVLPSMRAVVPDLLGAGDSDKPLRADVGIGAQAGYVRRLLERLGVERCAVVAHGHGGGVAQLLALEGGVEVMVLLDPIDLAERPSEPLRHLRRLSGDVDVAVGALMRTALEMGMGHQDRITGDLVAEYSRPFARSEGRAALARLAAILDERAPAVAESDVATLRIPVFLLWGEEDPFIPIAVAERMNEAIPTSTLALLPGCSHFLPEDAPATVVPLLYEYLRGVYLGRPHVHEGGAVPLTLERRLREDDR